MIYASFAMVGALIRVGVNAYAEPVVSLDLDLVVVAERISDLRAQPSQRR